MKQLKFILITAIAVVTVNSCSSDRDDEVKQEPTAKLDLKPLGKENSNNQETAKTGDTVVAGPATSTTSPGTGLEPTDPNDPELIPPGDIKPPKGGK